MKYWTINVREFTPEFPEQNDIRIDLLKENHYDCIIIFSQSEFTFKRIYRFDDILNISREKKIKIYAIVGCEEYNNNDFPKDIEIQWWKTSFLQLVPTDFIKNNIKINNLDDFEYKYHFVCFNDRINKHRIRLIDNLAKFDLLKYSAYSWHNTYHRILEGGHLSSEFKYYDGATKKLDEQYALHKNQFILPEEYYQSFFQIVSETTAQCKFITEKTVAPLLVTKPFLIAGAPGIHTMLKNLGFELYDELFDYSFDSEERTDYRYKKMCENNIVPLTKISLDNCKKLHIKIQDKINYNRKKLLEIASNQNLIPEIGKDIIQHYISTGEILDNQIINYYLENIKGLHL